MRSERAPGPLVRWLFGPRHVARLTVVHCLHSAAEATFTVSLAGSIFFSVSPDAARPRVLLFLAVTLAPFLLIAPLLGPLVDRLRGGLGVALIATFVVRAALALSLAQHLRTLLLFPLAFGVLLVAKTYTVARNAALPTLVAARDDLVAANARLSRTATIVGALAAAVAVVVYREVSPSATLLLAAAWYLGGAALAFTLRREIGAPTMAIRVADVELVRFGAGDAVADMAVLRAAAGFAIFHFGFALRAGGEPAWVLGGLLAANSLGAFAGTIIAPALRRRAAERTLFTVALAGSAAATALSAAMFNRVTLLVAVGVLGTAVSIGRRAMDSTIQSQAPQARTARVYARLETRLELIWVLAACVAVALRVESWIGVAMLAAFLVVVTVHHLRRRVGLRVLEPVASRPLGERLLMRAETLAQHGFHDEAYVIANEVLAAPTMVAGVEPLDDAARAAIERARERIADAFDGPVER